LNFINAPFSEAIPLFISDKQFVEVSIKIATIDFTKDKSPPAIASMFEVE
jgi:hypothetical protein